MFWGSEESHVPSSPLLFCVFFHFPPLLHYLVNVCNCARNWARHWKRTICHLTSPVPCFSLRRVVKLKDFLLASHDDYLQKHILSGEEYLLHQLGATLQINLSEKKIQ